MSRCPKCNFLLKSIYICDLCGEVIQEEPKKKSGLRSKSEKQVQVTKEDIVFFKSIWEKRPHICEVSGVSLGNVFNVCFFSHVLTKQAYPKFRHKEKNIVLCTLDWHQEWETGDRSLRELEWVVLLEERLKQEYYLVKGYNRFI